MSVPPNLTWAPGVEKVGRIVTSWLKQSQVAHYLVSLGLVNPRAVIDEDLTVSDVSRRNAVFLVTASRGPTYVVKQSVPGTAETLANEANVLRGLPRLAGAIPEVAHSGARLVLRTAPNAVAFGRGGRVSPLAARALGRTLAVLHASRPEVPPAPDAVVRSWGLSLPEPSHGQLRALSSGALDVLAQLQASREVCAELRRLGEERVEDAFVHGDLRWDNCLLVAGPGSTRRTRLLLIDWELAGTGDAAADLGVALAEYLALWVGSVPVVDPADPGRYLDRAGHPLDRLKPSISALWDGYRRSSGHAVSLRRVTSMAAVGLLQAAIEASQGHARPSLASLLLVQLAANLLRTPDDAARHLIGLRE